MKTLLIDRELSHPLLLPPPLTLIADSSITPPGRPVFLPEFSDTWGAELYFAIKISRLGKDISLKFASRYFDSFTVGLRLLPLALADALTHAGRHDGVTTIFDNALTLGQWQSFEDTPDDKPIIISINDLEAVIDSPRLCASQAVEAISRYCTLKTGDLILPFRLTPRQTVTTGTGITAALQTPSGPQPLLSIRLK